MSALPKSEQLGKSKKVNPKKMTRTELDQLKEFIHNKANGKCQCGCGRPITEYHHAYFGINKDDRYLFGIAQDPCHYAIHHGKDMDLKSKMILVSRKVAKQNYKDYIL